MNNTVVSYNRYNSTSSDGAGGIFILTNMDLELNNTTIDNNTFDGRYYGAGGIFGEQSVDVTIIDSTISNNEAISNNPTAFPYSYAQPAGGVRIYRFSTTVITNSTISNNTTNSYAGGINSYYQTSITITNTTIANNNADAGGGGMVYESLADGHRLYIKNSILANNTGNSVGDDFHAISTASSTANRLVDNGYNLVEFSTNKTWSGTGDITGAQASLNLSETLADNMTANDTQTLALSVGSVAIDAGEGSVANNSISIPANDQRGGTRSGTTDIGSYEYGAGGFDSTDPAVDTLLPADDATDSELGNNLIVTFDEVVDVESGNISIYKTTGDELIEDIVVTSGQVTGTGTTDITIDPTDDFEEATEYYVQIDATAFGDSSDNSFAGITDTTTWSFTTLTLPYVVSVDPSNGATGVSNEPVFTATFSEAIDTGESLILSTDVCNFNGGDCATPSITEWSIGDTVATIQNGNGAYAYDTTYTMTINQLISAANGSDIAEPYEWVFTIESAPETNTSSKGGSSAKSRAIAMKAFDEYYGDDDEEREKFDTEVVVEEVVQNIETEATSEVQSKSESEAVVTTNTLQAIIASGGLLRRGSKGDAVAELQNILNTLGVDPQLLVDGDFGRLTHEAVEVFQEAQGLVVDGFVGKDTLAQLI